MAGRWPETETAPLVQTHGNGVRTLAVSRPYGELATVVAALPAGAVYERSADEFGAAGVLSRSIPYGTTSHPSTAALAEAIEGIGGTFGVDSGDDGTSLSANVPADQLAAAAAIVTELATQPLLHDDAIARERQVMIGRLRAAATEPSSKAGELLGTLLWPSSSLGRTFDRMIIGVDRLDAEQVRAFYHRQFAARAVVIGASAPLSADAIVSALQRHVHHWPVGDPAPITALGDPGGRFAFATMKSELAYLALGALAVPFDHPDRYGLNVLAVALGGGMTSRLFKEVREKRGLCYGIGARLGLHRIGGSFSIQAGVPANRFKEAVDAILEQVELSKTDLSESEVDRAKALIRGRLAMESDDAGQTTSRYVSDVLYFGRPRLAREILAQVDALTPSDLGRLATTYLAPDRLRLAVAGTFEGEPPSAALLGV